MTKRELIDENWKQKNEIFRLKAEVSNFKSLLEAELQAKENGCHRGDYCSACKHAVLIGNGGRTTCYCVYGQCEHFEKEFHVQEF